MDAESIYRELKEIALTIFSGIVNDCFVVRGPLNFPRCLRIIFVDDSFMEVRISEEKYSFHYDRRLHDGKIFRIDNAPHHTRLKTYPDHFHEESEDTIKENTFGKSHRERFMGFMEFIKKIVVG